MASALDPYGHYFWVSRPELLLLFMLFKKLYITQLSGVMEDVMLFQEVIWAWTSVVQLIEYIYISVWTSQTACSLHFQFWWCNVLWCVCEMCSAIFPPEWRTVPTCRSLLAECSGMHEWICIKCCRVWRSWPGRQDWHIHAEDSIAVLQTFCSPIQFIFLYTVVSNATI